MATQKNLKWYRYVTNGGVNMGIMCEDTWGDNASSGLAPFNATDPPFGPQSRTHHTRKAVYKDPQTFRTIKHPVGTVAALAALPATFSVSVPGLAAPIAYNLAQRIDEKMRIPGPSRPLADHT